MSGNADEFREALASGNYDPDEGITDDSSNDSTPSLDDILWGMNQDNRPTLMQCNPGITTPNLTAEPLWTEGELTEGPDHINPYRSVQEREIVNEINQQRRATGIEMDPDMPGVDFYALEGGPQF